jgi:hypothetical protein
MLGNGGPAAGHGSVAAARMRRLAPENLDDIDQVRRLERVSAGIDQRVCEAFEYGIWGRLYFQRTIGPGMNSYSGSLVQVMRPRWLPVTGPVCEELLGIVRSELRPVPAVEKPPRDAAQNRRDFEAAITHRSGDPGPSLST